MHTVAHRAAAVGSSVVQCIMKFFASLNRLWQCRQAYPAGLEHWGDSCMQYTHSAQGVGWRPRWIHLPSLPSGQSMDRRRLIEKCAPSSSRGKIRCCMVHAYMHVCFARTPGCALCLPVPHPTTHEC